MIGEWQDGKILLHLMIRSRQHLRKVTMARVQAPPLQMVFLALQIAVLLISATFVSGCSNGECNKLRSRADSNSGRFSAEIYEAGNCIATMNTVVTDVVARDMSARIFRERNVFSVSNSIPVRLSWSSPTQLTIEHGAIDAHSRIYRQ
jgi:hypothetical protein